MKRIIRGTLAAAAFVLASAGCSGENWFTGPGTGVDGDGSAPPTVLAIRVPEFVNPGDVLDVEIDAAGAEGIASVDVTLVEAAVRDRTLLVDPPEASVTAFTQFVLPSPLTRTSVLVRAEAQDRRGTRSEPLEVEIPVVQNEGTTVRF